MSRALWAVLTFAWVPATGVAVRALAQESPPGEAATGEPSSAWTATAGRPRRSADSFEALLAEATPSVDLGTLVSPFLEDCAHARRPIDAARCRGVTSYLKQTMPALTYATIVTHADAVEVSDYDARIKGFRVSAVGCLACQEPVAVGNGDAKRLVTLRMPDKSARSLLAGLGVASASFSFEDVAASRAWLAQVRPHLRVQYVFEPSDKQWSFGPSRGFAFTLLGARIFDHCTGEVLYSQPKSEGLAPKYAEGQECRGGEAGAPDGASDLPLKLSPTDITRALNQIRPQLDGCHQQYELHGRAELDITVSGATGLPRSVSLRGSLEGTAVGQCLAEAARKAVFPKFRQDSQNFSYPLLFKQR